MECRLLKSKVNLLWITSPIAPKTNYFSKITDIYATISIREWYIWNEIYVCIKYTRDAIRVCIKYTLTANQNTSWCNWWMIFFHPTFMTKLFFFYLRFLTQLIYPLVCLGVHWTQFCIMKKAVDIWNTVKIFLKPALKNKQEISWHCSKCKLIHVHVIILYP